MDITLEELMNFIKRNVDKDEIMIVVTICDDMISLKIWYPNYDVSASETIFEPQLSKEEIYKSLLDSIGIAKTELSNLQFS